MTGIQAYFHFRWPVAVRGYRWETLSAGLAGSRPALLPVSLVAQDYYPMREYTGLFLSFAGLEPTTDAILAFANQYGTLEHYEPARRELAGPQTSYDRTSISRDSPDVLEHQVAETAPDPWEAAERPSVAVSWLTDWAREITALKDQVGSVAGLSVYASPLTWDRRALINDCMHKRLAGHIVPVLSDDVVGVECVPTTLLGAIWLQFALAVAQNKQYRRCEAPGCPRQWFEVSRSPFGLRPEAKYCSPTCRTRAWVARKSEQQNP